MHFRQRSVLEVGKRVQSFLDVNASVLGRMTRAGECAELDAAVSAIEECAAAQAELYMRSTSHTKIKNVRRKELLDEHIAPIVTIARKSTAQVASFSTVRMPKRRTPDSMLVTEALALATMAAKHKRKFLSQGLPRHFLDECRAAAKALQRELRQRDLLVQTRMQATAAIDIHVSAVREAVPVLHALVVKAIPHRADLLTAWNTAKAYGRKPGVKRRRSRKAGNKESKAV